MLDEFCALSLTYRNNGFVTILAPLRDYLCPKDPASSSFLNITKEAYFMQLSEKSPGFKKSRWIATEDINIEFPLDVFTTIDTDSESVWGACDKFITQLSRHKPRLIMLGPKIEALPDSHLSKARCLSALSQLFDSVGHSAEYKRLLSHSLTLWRERGDGAQVALTLRKLSDKNRQMGLREEGIQLAEEASEIFERFGEVVQQAHCLINLAWLLCDTGRLDAAEEAGSRGLDLLPEKGEEFRVCEGRRVLGRIYRSKGETEKAIHHLKVTIGIAPSLNQSSRLFWIHFDLAEMFSEQGKFDDAVSYQAHQIAHD